MSVSCSVVVFDADWGDAETPSPAHINSSVPSLQKGKKKIIPSVTFFKLKEINRSFFVMLVVLLAFF